MAKTQKSRGIFKTGVGQGGEIEIHKQKKKKKKKQLSNVQCR